jgi:hypothetical protein
LHTRLGVKRVLDRHMDFPELQVRYLEHWFLAPVEPFFHGFLLCIFSANPCPLFVGSAEIVFLVLYLLMHILKDVDVPFVFHSSVYAYAASYRLLE